jgi:hypothetical protein
MAHSYDNTSLFVPFVDIPVSLGSLFQGIESIYLKMKPCLLPGQVSILAFCVTSPLPPGLALAAQGERLKWGEYCSRLTRNIEHSTLRVAPLPGKPDNE